ncbi:MAG: DASS family sodium-coupled anion symporter [Candidatus Diapherotrites archaeon]
MLGPILGFLAYSLDLPIPPQAKIVFGITVLAVVYWFSEVIELHVTGLMIAFLLIVLGGFTPAQIFPNYFDPVVMLLLGGFMLALALQKFELDELIALRAARHFGHDPKWLILGFMALTAFLSFWVSNTASAAVMIPIALYIIRKNKLDPGKSNFARAFILCVAYAATIGGLGTLVGSTPNPLAAKYINEMGVSFGFTDWMLYGLPFVVVFLLVIWVVVRYLFKPEIDKVDVELRDMKLNGNQEKVLGIFFVTILLWIFGEQFGLVNSVVAIVPIILLYLLKLVDEKDFGRVDWGILSLIGSGIALGYAFHQSGFDSFVASLIQGIVIGQPLFLVIFVISVFSVLLTMFASNTASAAIMIPLMIPLAPIIGVRPEVLIVIVAVGVSLDFTAPMGTPPNAIAYSTGYVNVLQMAKSGLLLSLLASLLLAVFATFVWI